MIGLPLFLIVAGFTLASTLVVTLSRNLVYSGFSLLGTFFGVAVLYIFLSADFVGVTQLLVYVGGVLILVLFAIMLTKDIQDVRLTNLSTNQWIAAPLVLILFVFLVRTLTENLWMTSGVESFASSTESLGDALLTEYVLPFEIISLLLLATLIGAVVIVRREVR